MLWSHLVWRLLLPVTTGASPRRGLVKVRKGFLRLGDSEFSGIGGPIPDTSSSPESSPDRENRTCSLEGSSQRGGTGAFLETDIDLEALATVGIRQDGIVVNVTSLGGRELRVFFVFFGVHVWW